MTDADEQALRELDELGGALTAAQFDALENELILRAAVCGWTGDPLRQPAATVLAALRAVLAGTSEFALWRAPERE
jgi:hypothetical protein